MSVTITHRPHIHLPWRTITIFLGAAAVAAAVLVLVNQPWEAQEQGTTGITGTTTAMTAAGPAVKTAPRPLERNVRSAARTDAAATGAAAAATGARPAEAVMHNRVMGITLDGGRKRVFQPSAPWYPPGAVDNARPLNLTASGSR